MNLGKNEFKYFDFTYEKLEKIGEKLKKILILLRYIIIKNIKVYLI